MSKQEKTMKSNQLKKTLHRKLNWKNTIHKQPDTLSQILH